MKRYTLLLFILLTNLQLSAYDPILLKCIETPEIHDIDSIPKEFNYSNNLRRRTGASDIAIGTLIHVVGRVTDINCLPIQNAEVYIWHADASGYNKNIKQHRELHDINFTGSGKFTTNNLGYYHFITIIPGKGENRAPHINFLIQHSDFPKFTTQMFFDDIKDLDPVLTTLPKAYLLIAPLSYNKDSIKTYTFNITLGGYNKFSSTR